MLIVLLSHILQCARGLGRQDGSEISHLEFISWIIQSREGRWSTPQTIKTIISPLGWFSEGPWCPRSEVKSGIKAQIWHVWARYVWVMTAAFWDDKLFEKRFSSLRLYINTQSGWGIVKKCRTRKWLFEKSCYSMSKLYECVMPKENVAICKNFIFEFLKNMHL